MVSWYGNILREALAEPHCDVSFHVDGKRFESLLQSTYRKVAEAADVLTQVDPAHLGQAKTANGYEAYRCST